MEPVYKLRRLSELSPAYRKEAESALNNPKNGVIQPSKEYDEYGLRFPVGYLIKLGWMAVLFPLEHMALYVDVLTKECIDSHDKDVYKIIQKHMKKAGLDLSAINAIGFGNLAYIALHAKNEKMQKEAIKILEDVIELRQADIAEVLRVGKNAMDKNVN